MRTINPAFIDKIALTIIQHNSNAGYNVDNTPEIKSAVIAIIRNKGLDTTNLNDILVYREKFEKTVSKRFKIKYTYTLDEDIEVKLNASKATQFIKVKSGLIDFLIGRLGVEVVAV